MSCVVGYVDKDVIYMGGDSAATGDGSSDQRLRKSEKVFRLTGQNDTEIVVGFCGSYRIGYFLKHCFELPAAGLRQEPQSYVYRSFLPDLEDQMVRNKIKLTGSEILVGFRGRLFLIEEDFSPTESMEHFEACGEGGPYALGALYILSKDDRYTPEEKVTMALTASSMYCSVVRPPFKIVRV